jgi:hypothetical protein
MLDLPHPVVSADGRSNVSAILLRVQCGGPNPEPQGGEDEIRSLEGPLPAGAVPKEPPQ